MTTPIAKLIERIEKLTGNATKREAVEMGLVSPDDFDLPLFRMALMGDLSSAVAFVEAALPGCSWTLTGEGDATVQRADDVFNQETERVEFAPTPAIALVLASLRALHTREGRG